MEDSYEKLLSILMNNCCFLFVSYVWEKLRQLFNSGRKLFETWWVLLYSYYSTYGHVLRLAEEIQKGAASVEGVEVKLWQVRVLLPL